MKLTTTRFTIITYQCMAFSLYICLIGLSSAGPASNHLRNSDPGDYNPMIPIPSGQADTMNTDILGDPLSPMDYNLGNNMVEDQPDLTGHVIDPIEFAGLYEGDISITIEDANMIRKGKKLVTSRVTSVDGLKRKWPNGVVPYVISSKYNEYERGVLAKAFTTIQNVSCIRFVPRGAEEDYIHILQGDGCFSSVGRIGSGQVVSIGLLCITVPMIMHELMHALGFWHEQSRPDRDNYVKVITENIMPGMKKNFEIIHWDTLGISYDAKSIMHYKPYTFSKNRKVPNGNPTLISKTSREMGQRRNLEDSDIKKINVYYQCDALKTEETHPVSSLGPDTTTCSDLNEYCLMWGEQNECLANPAYMQLYCRKSCGLCIDLTDTNPNVCEDKSIYCEPWKADYQCTVNPVYMNLYCKKSCGKCQMSNGIFK